MKKYILYFAAVYLGIGVTIVACSYIDYVLVYNGKKPMMSGNAAFAADGGTVYYPGILYEVVYHHRMAGFDSGMVMTFKKGSSVSFNYGKYFLIPLVVNFQDVSISR